MIISDVSILYIEDDATAREILSSLLTAKYPAIQFYSAGSVNDALELFKERRQSIIITDINLAESDGIQMVRSIRRMDPETIIIFISGCSDIERITEFEGSGSCHYICKPLDYNNLIELLDSYIHILTSNKRQKVYEQYGHSLPGQI